MSTGDGDIPLEEGLAWLRRNMLKPLCEKVEAGFENVSGAWFTNQEYAEMYAKCYNMCIQRPVSSGSNYTAELYKLHGSAIKEFLVATVLPLLEQKQGVDLLQELASRWDRHKIMNKWLKKLFTYLDRYYTPQESLPKLLDAGLRAFRDLIFIRVNERTTTTIVDLVDSERDGELVDRDLLNKCVNVYITLSDVETDGVGSSNSSVGANAVHGSLYDELERCVIERACAYYSRKASEWVSMDATPEYLSKAEAALQKEDDRVNAYLKADTKSKLKAACVKELLQKYEKVLLEKEGSGCRALLRDDKKEDLHRMFKLFSLVEGGLEPMAAIVRTHVKEMGLSIVEERKAGIENGEKDTAHNPEFVKALIALHDKYADVVAEQFSGHSSFTKAMQSAFEVFINQDAGKHSNSEMISTYCDRILRGGGGTKLSDEEIDKELDKIVEVFTYLSDKDIFSAIYRNQLAKRLLNGRSTSDEAEKSMIGKLKIKCGAQFTTRMEGMVNDLKMGADTRRSFAEFQRSSSAASSSAIAFSVDVLSTGHWPSYTKMEVTLPPSCRCASSSFQPTTRRPLTRRCSRGRTRSEP